MDNDEHPEDGNTLSHLILPNPRGAIFPGSSAGDLFDCGEERLERLSDLFNVVHLAECTDAKLFEYPITGIVNGNFMKRFVIPLKVRALQSSKDFIVYFVVDSGAPVISFSKNTADKIFGGKSFASAIVQDILVDCRLSGTYNKSLENVNLLSSQFLLRSNTSLIIPPHDYRAEKSRTFYLTPFSMIGQVQKMAAALQQRPNFAKKLEIRSVQKVFRSDPTHSQKEKIEKAFPALEKLSQSHDSDSGEKASPPLEKPDESLPSTSWIKMDNDEHPKDGNTPPNLILPCPGGPFLPSALAADLVDCDEEGLERFSDLFNVEHLSECTNAKLFKYPIKGVVCGIGNRFVIPLRVQSRQSLKEKKRNFIVYFVVDSGAPFTSFSKKTVDRLFEGKGVGNAIVQDVFVNCCRSEEYDGSLKNVNLLGSRFLLGSKTSLIISPHEFDYRSDKIRTFYLTPFSMIGQAKIMAASLQQRPNRTKKSEFDLMKKRKKDSGERASSPLKKPDESRPSTLLTSDFDTQMPSHHGSPEMKKTKYSD